MPLSLGDLWRACTRNADARRRLEDAIAEYHGAEAGFGLSSGRAALWLALRALHRMRPERDVVILPAYTCPTVGRSVIEAGLQGRCADISLETFNIDPAEVEACIDERVLAVVAAHMFGLPCNLTALSNICRERDVYLIEDCAQCVGGRWTGELVGTYGDVGFLSMGRSKNLRGYEGGVLWTNDVGLVEPLREEFEGLPGPRSGTKGKLRQAAITILSEPYLWAMAKRLPGLNVGAEDQSFDPHPSKLADWQAALGLISLERLEEYNEHRRHLADALREALSNVDGIRCQSVPPEAQPTYLRFATRLTDGDADRRDALVARLQRHNVDARAFYTCPMHGYEWMDTGVSQDAHPGAAAAVEANLVLPISHPDDEAAASTVAEIVGTELSVSS
ncbi:MAG: DegT/DnrJ/EryC1/StrS family aminotransferase [Armatimonadota bacterium]|nr:DegT/DnrJ/EryC1/StrS family aminotransferase [Armatimonadota bacterium]